MLMYLPSEVPRGCLPDRRRHRGHVGSHVVLEATLTNEAQQALQIGDFDHAGAAEGGEWVVGEAAFADVAVDAAVLVVGGKAREAHGAGLHDSLAGAVGVFAADRSVDDLLEFQDRKSTRL